MERDNSQTLHVVVIMGLKDPSKSEKVALALSRIIKNMPEDKILKRLGTLPWTLTRKATPKNASRLSRYLEKAGAKVMVDPPLAAPVMTDVAETQILPDTHLLSQTQVMSAMDDPPAPGTPLSEPLESPPPQQPPPPIEPRWRKVAPQIPVTERTPPPPVPPPDEGGLPIEPMTLGGMLDRTFQICRRYFWKLLAVIAVWWGIATVIGIAAFLVALAAALIYQKVPLWLLITMAIVLIPVTMVVLAAGFCLSQGALIHAVSSVYLGREIRVGEAYSFALGRLRKLIVAYMIVIALMLGIVLATVAAGAAVYFLFYALTSSTGAAVLWSIVFWLALAVVPMYVGTKLVLVDKVIIIEDAEYMEALKRSWSLLSGKADGPWPRGYFVRLIVLMNLFLLINLAVGLLFQIPAAMLMLAPLPETLASILNHVLSNAGSVVASLFGSVCMVIFYYDIRNRKEGFDLEMLAESKTGRSS